MKYAAPRASCAEILCKQRQTPIIRPFPAFFKLVEMHITGPLNHLKNTSHEYADMEFALISMPHIKSQITKQMLKDRCVKHKSNIPVKD